MVYSIVLWNSVLYSAVEWCIVTCCGTVYSRVVWNGLKYSAVEWSTVGVVEWCIV